MNSAQGEVTLKASADLVWQIVGNFNGLQVWHPAVTGSQLTAGDNNEVGAERLLALDGGGTIKERLLDYSSSERRYRYCILDSPLPVSGYESVVRVEDSGDGRCRVVWSGSFAAQGVSDGQAAEIVQGIYDAGLGYLREQFAG
ncbi:SRPBCC family protein [Pseudomonas sp. zfem002]|uniref:SRPBCC family protein n=1 Tax=Pseudomonas sp. zfem002 TaxID=3078197 RepID=UPI0029283B3F|nr:SRPBCC family protein [Pseudomonas sp. zfem002]MDU9393898.1 SRPBCC family protein [Pseudomonas sp. zfem002]